jgi:hypothetical protein
MSSKELFASKLASGTAVASKMALWWPKHCHASLELLAACAEGRDGAHDLEKGIVAIAKEWEESVSVAKGRRAGADVGLMVEHSVLETDLVYAVLQNNSQAIERTADRMVDNAKVQATRYAHSITGFPSVRFGFLIQEHVELFIEAVRSRFDRNAMAAAKCSQLMDENSVALAAIAAEWF